ncbi:hypothetical protein LZ554_006919 [Drepanopeziza brunnea f. sp. 'monogermtubi']|nr:hypothetical protein LZ554_006919 [Drepanopeziza brunnea f. sp. 'monogermtubi']
MTPLAFATGTRPASTSPQRISEMSSRLGPPGVMVAYAIDSNDSSPCILGNISQGVARLFRWILGPCLPDDNVRTAILYYIGLSSSLSCISHRIHQFTRHMNLTFVPEPVCTGLPTTDFH